MNKDFLLELNPPQKQAVEYCEGPSLVIAGAGSGKTRVLTYKIAYLLQEGLPVSRILALTFTNKAAREMKSRIQEITGTDQIRRLWMGTFHSIFARILRAEADRLGFNSAFSIFDSADSKNAIKRIIKDLGLSEKQYSPASVSSRISRAKNNLIDYKRYANDPEWGLYDDSRDRSRIRDIYRIYQETLKSSNSMDFDDLLMYTYQLFSDHPEVLERYQQQFEYILIDEYQDTNYSQHAIIKLLGSTHHRVFAVGDDAQSIYSFRGADISNILKFSNDFNETKIFKLEQNYRSTKNIVGAANSLIKKNRSQIPKTVFSENTSGEKVKIESAYSDLEEGSMIANKIEQMHLQYQIPYDQFAILYRTNFQSRIFESALRKKNIPYKIGGGLSFFQRKEIKDIIAYLRFINNTSDEESLRRIINYPARGIGEVTVKKLIESAHAQNQSVWELIETIEECTSFKSSAQAKIIPFRTTIAKYIQLFSEKKQSLGDLVARLVEESGIIEEISKDELSESVVRVENIEELVNSIYEYSEIFREENGEEPALFNFLSEVALDADSKENESEEEQRVMLMTVHAAKGLEFDNVFIAGMEENLFPLIRSNLSSQELEEERRLFYVGITRAKYRCHITYALSRYRNGASSPQKPSRFINELDDKFAEKPLSLTSASTSFDSKEFWEQRNKKNINNQKQPATISTHSSPSKMTRIPKGIKNEGERDGLGDLVENCQIRHERFGKGIVLKISSEGGDKRALVKFENFGEKQLLLKFAKFEII